MKKPRTKRAALSIAAVSWRRIGGERHQRIDGEEQRNSRRRADPCCERAYQCKDRKQDVAHGLVAQGPQRRIDHPAFGHVVEDAGQRERMGDEGRGQGHEQPGPRIGEIVLPRDEGHERTEHEGDAEAGDQEPREQAEEARHRIIDEGWLRHHAAGDEKPRDDEEHVDRQATDLQRLDVDDSIRRLVWSDKGEAVIEDHGGGREKPDQIEIVVSAVEQSGDRIRHWLSRDLLRPATTRSYCCDFAHAARPVQAPYRRQGSGDSGAY